MKLGILGVGKMGMSIVNGILSRHVYEKEDIFVYDVYNNDKLKEDGFNVVKDEVALFQSVDIFLFAIKPQSFPEVLEKLSGLDGAKIIISIAAGIKVEYLKKYLGEERQYVRVMPNTPALIGHAASAISFENATCQNLIYDIFDSIGMSKEIDESQMDDIIPANGSMPAYAYYFMDAFIKSSVNRGIDIDVAKELVCNSVIGSAMMILASKRPISELINDVCSKGGTTIEGIKVFDEYGLRKIIDEAARKCVNRSIELGKK